MIRKARRPSPALVLAMVALFAALGGYATAATVVPLAKRALQADNAKKLGGQTLAQINAASTAKATTIAKQEAQAAAELPGPASSIAGLLTVKTAPWSIAPGQQADLTVTCDAGQKAISGGWEDPAGYGHSWDSRPAADGTGWRTFVTVSTNAPGQQSGTLYAVCVK